jgi:hypothetical protein
VGIKKMLDKLRDKLTILKFWWAEKRIKEGRDYHPSIDELGLLVTILRGEFTGVEFRFGPICVKEDPTGTQLLEFNTVVVYNPTEADVLSKKFEKLTSDILRILLRSAIRETEEQVIDENRNVDTGELAQERDIHEEVAPILEERVSKRKSRKKAVSADSGSHSEVQQRPKSKRPSNRNSGKKRPVGK